MRTRRTLAVLLAAGMVLGAAGMSPAATISINHVGGAGANGTLAPTDYAGVVPAANWNNFASYPPGGTATVYGPSPLVFDDGTASGATVQVTSTDGWAQDQSYGTTTGDRKMMRGATNFAGSDNASLTIANLRAPFASAGYDVYVYTDSTGSRNAAVTLNGTTTLTLKTTENISYPSSGYDDGTVDQSGNYVKFSGVTDTGFTLDLFRDPNSGGRPGYTGFQIVGASTPPALVPGQIALIDVNDARGVPAAPDVNGNHWNAVDATPDTVSLVDTSNATTGWTLTQGKNPTGGGSGLSGGLNNTVAAPFPYNIPEAYADSWYDNTNGGSKGQFSFSGLDSSSEYELKLFGARPSSAKNGAVEVTTGTAAGGSLHKLVPGNLLTITAQPDSSGDLTFTFDTLAGSTADINLMSIQEFSSGQPIPEPATMCALGLAVAGLGGYIRRRRRG